MSNTIEKMLKDSNDRLAAHLAERMALTNDKVRVSMTITVLLTLHVCVEHSVGES